MEGKNPENRLTHRTKQISKAVFFLIKTSSRKQSQNGARRKEAEQKNGDSDKNEDQRLYPDAAVFFNRVTVFRTEDHLFFLSK